MRNAFKSLSDKYSSTILNEAVATEPGTNIDIQSRSNEAKPYTPPAVLKTLNHMYDYLFIGNNIIKGLNAIDPELANKYYNMFKQIGHELEQDIQARSDDGTIDADGNINPHAPTMKAPMVG